MSPDRIRIGKLIDDVKLNELNETSGETLIDLDPEGTAGNMRQIRVKVN